MRVAPRLNAGIADTVPTGSILQVVGKFNRWLKIHHNGRDVWLADWVDYSRIDSAAPTGSQGPAAPTGSQQPAAPIDNCCFVDRQCQSEQEWSDGYWAYQDGQCAAPAQPQPAAPAQPVSSAPAIVDNCCFVDRQCQSEQDWIAGYDAFQNGQCAAPAQPQPATPAQPSAIDLASGGNCCSLGWDCWMEEERVQGYYAYQMNQCAGLPQLSAITLTGPVPRIEGSDQFVQHIIATLKMMQSLAPHWYNYVITGLDLIVEEPVHIPPARDGQQDTCWAFANDSERKATVQTCFMLSTIRYGEGAEFDQADTAGMLGHEACHIHTYEEGKHFGSQAEEEELCAKMGTGARILLDSAISARLDPRRGTKYLDVRAATNRQRAYCSEGYRADLFCPTWQRMESEWRDVPFDVFPPGAPVW